MEALPPVVIGGGPASATQAASSKSESKDAFRVDSKGTQITFFCGERIYVITPDRALEKDQLQRICASFQKAFEEDEGAITRQMQLASGHNLGQFEGDKNFKDRSFKVYQYVITDKGIEFHRIIQDPKDLKPGQQQDKIKHTIEKVDGAANRELLPLNIDRRRDAHPDNPLEHNDPEENRPGGPGVVEGAAEPVREENVSISIDRHINNAIEALVRLEEGSQLDVDRDNVEDGLRDAERLLTEIPPNTEEYRRLHHQLELLRLRQNNIND